MGIVGGIRPKHDINALPGRDEEEEGKRKRKEDEESGKKRRTEEREEDAEDEKFSDPLWDRVTGGNRGTVSSKDGEQVGVVKVEAVGKREGMEDQSTLGEDEEMQAE